MFHRNYIFLLNLVLMSSAKCTYNENINISENLTRIDDTKIVGGTLTTIEKHPYLVQLKIGIRKCSGFIISTQWIMTAAHCINNAALVIIRVGSSILDQGLLPLLGSTNIIVHELYNNQTNDYDFGLIGLTASLSFGDTIGSINLPAQDAGLPWFGPLTVAGWGLANTGASNPNTLKAVNVKRVPHYLCNLLYEGAITDTMFCGGVLMGGKGSCDGDSGGPVVYKNVAVGIISASGNICGSVMRPSIFARISAVTNWVKLKTGIP